MVLIHLLSNHFLRRSMSRLSRIGAAYAPVGAVSSGTSPGPPDPDTSLTTTCICHVHRLGLFDVRLSFPICAIRTKNTAVASLHLERIWSVLPCVIQRPPTSARTSPANPRLTFCAAGP
jgi:hypothetical protein